MCSLFTPKGGLTRLLLYSPVEHWLYRAFCSESRLRCRCFQSRPSNLNIKTSRASSFPFLSPLFLRRRLYLLFLDGMYRPSSCLFLLLFCSHHFFFFFLRVCARISGGGTVSMGLQQYWLRVHTLCSHLGVFSYFFLFTSALKQHQSPVSSIPSILKIVTYSFVGCTDFLLFQM